MIINAFQNALNTKIKRQWDFIYIAIDLHGTICEGHYENDQSVEIYPYAEDVLRIFTEAAFIKTILYTCTHAHDIEQYLKIFSSKGIHFDYVNENPECPSTNLADFSKKLHYNALIDDKAGFDPADWKLILEWWDIVVKSPAIMQGCKIK
jgi:hypothetical protein